jgi:8-oxo-dGTP pyrophosphatase MutT (NUDIX family)
VIADRIAGTLAGRSPQTLDGGLFTPAAVLVPVQETEEGDCLILTKRAERLNFHSGQIAFPGGKVDARDTGALAAALRESQEEIGIAPGDVRVLGQLDQVVASTNILVTPFVGVIPYPYEFHLNPEETAAIFAIPLAALMDPTCCVAEDRTFPSGKRALVYHYYYRDWDIWGVTARIVKQLLDLAFEPARS